MIRKDNGSNNSLFLSWQMGPSDGAFFMIKHTPLSNGNHPILSPVCPMGVADTLEQYFKLCGLVFPLPLGTLDKQETEMTMTFAILHFFSREISMGYISPLAFLRYASLSSLTFVWTIQCQVARIATMFCSGVIHLLRPKL